MLARHKGQPEELLASILETSSHYFLSKVFDVLGRTMQGTHPRQNIL